MRKLIKLVLCILVVVLCILIIPKIQVSDTTTIDTIDYWLEEEMDLLYLYFIK